MYYLGGRRKYFSLFLYSKQFCLTVHILVKDKADVLLELQRLNGVKNELTDEVTRLHGLLEQERSKVAALTADPQHKHKDKVSV